MFEQNKNLWLSYKTQSYIDFLWISLRNIRTYFQYFNILRLKKVFFYNLTLNCMCYNYNILMALRF